jgi:hypothetical protein
MTNNELQDMLDALDLPTKTRVAARDLEVDDWASRRPRQPQRRLAPSGNRTPRDSRRTEVILRTPNGTRARWFLNNADTVWRSLTPLDQPPPQGSLARRALSTKWPTTPFRVHAILGGVNVRWTDGPPTTTSRAADYGA